MPFYLFGLLQSPTEHRSGFQRVRLDLRKVHLLLPLQKQGCQNLVEITRNRQDIRVIPSEARFRAGDLFQRYCEDLGEHLADIKSEAEETFLERFSRKQYKDFECKAYHLDKDSNNCVRVFVFSMLFPGYNEGFWLGATDVESEGTFVWRDGTNVSDFYVNWGPSQPNNANGIEHCLKTVKTDDEWKWRDGKCQRKLFSLCEFD
ncbi:pulmonary surfactant-associated protein D-like [Mercenaria mercenaria]|uniref:pulmonary surfactant-associated protein D-like n=1 Tax=Mercenaria mercenaria TaxID=6596 RepID=UPI00234E42CE|nr:pulmonary surfactant-associated protein D-like [Mercenaria mercenaria]